MKPSEGSFTYFSNKNIVSFRILLEKIYIFSHYFIQFIFTNNFEFKVNFKFIKTDYDHLGCIHECREEIRVCHLITNK